MLVEDALGCLALGLDLDVVFAGAFRVLCVEGEGDGSVSVSG